MGKRDLLFIGTCCCVLAIVTGSLSTRHSVGNTSSPATNIATTREDFTNTVQRVNALFANDWQQSNMQPAQPANTLIVARRLSLALTGAIPSYEEIRSLQQVPADTRITWWVEKLLADQRYYDYLAERLARAYVGTEEGPFLVYRRRRFVSWLSDQLADNQSYDQLVRELITVNGLWTDSPAANFVTVTIDQNEDNQPDQTRLAGRITRAFLGIRIDCLQCHDDKLEQVVLGNPTQPRTGLQSDFHQLAAYFGSVENSLTGIRDKPSQQYQFKYLGQDDLELVQPAVPFYPHLLGNEGSKRERLAAWLTSEHNEAFARSTVNRIWAIMFGQPMITPIDSIPLHGPFPVGLEVLARDFSSHGFDLARLIRIIASLDVFQLDSRARFPITNEHEIHRAVFPLTRLRPEQVAGSIIQSCSLTSIDDDAHILRQLVRYFSQNDFVKRYGDLGDDEFRDRGGTVTQRLLMMNGSLVKDKTKDNPFGNASTRIIMVTSDDRTAIETAYLTVLSRLPSDREQQYFQQRWKASSHPKRSIQMEDLFWVLLNSTEFSWNH